MIDGGLNYDKTVETKKIVFNGQTYQKVISYIFIFITTGISLGIVYFLLETQLQNNPSNMDYFVVIFFSFLIICVVAFFIHLLLTRDKLKEFEIQISKSKAIVKILEAAKNINWEPYSVTDKYLIFSTKFGFTKDCQTVTLIVFPDNRIYFNSINFPNDYMKVARFDENYKELKTEYLRIEKK